MEIGAHPNVLLEDTSRREKAKERLYAAFQIGGWGIFLLFQLIGIQFFSDAAAFRDYWTVISSNVAVVAMGLLLTHFARPFLTRWRWKQLGWRPLVPRAILASMVMSIIWSVVGFGYFHGILQIKTAS